MARQHVLAKNQVSRTNELDVAGEQRVIQALRHFWHPVARSFELGPEDPLRVVLLDQQLVLARLDGEARAFNDLCAHRGTALSLGKVLDGTRLRCPYHGWEYDATGTCRLAPQRPDLADSLRPRVRKYHVAERYGLIWVCLEDTPHYPLGEFPQYDDPTYRKMHLTTPDWSCSAPRRVENYSDLAHFAFVHDGVLGDINDPSIKPHDVTRDEHTLTLSMTEPIWAGSMKNRAMTNPVPAISHWKLFMPLTILLTVTSGEEQYCLFFHPTPLGAKKTRNFTIAARNYGDPTDDYSKFQEFQDLVYEQDREIVESQRPEELPEDLSFEMHLKGVDTLSITYRRWLKKLADELASS